MQRAVTDTRCRMGARRSGTQARRGEWLLCACCWQQVQTRAFAPANMCVSHWWRWSVSSCSMTCSRGQGADTALTTVIQGGSEPVVSELLAAGADANSATDVRLLRRLTCPWLADGHAALSNFPLGRTE